MSEVMTLGLGTGLGLRRALGASEKSEQSWGVEDATVMAWLRAARAGTGAAHFLGVGDSNQQFAIGGTGFGWDWGLPRAAQLAGFEIYASPLARLISQGVQAWTPSGIATNNPFADSGAPSEMTNLYAGFRSDGTERFGVHGYDYAASAGGSEGCYRISTADRFWENGEPLTIRFHHGKNTAYGSFPMYCAYDDGSFEEIDQPNRTTAVTAGSASLAISSRIVAEGAVAAGRPWRYAIMRGADRPTYPLFMIAGTVGRTGMTYGLRSTTIWAAGGQSLWDMVENLSTYETANGVKNLLERIYADDVAQGIASPRLIVVWQMGINDRAETGTSIDGVNANNTKAGYKANLTYCMDYVEAAAAAAGIIIGHKLCGPHVRPDNSYVGDDLNGDEEQLILLRDANDEIARSRARTMSLRDDAYLDGATMDGDAWYDAGGTAHLSQLGYRSVWEARWNALGFSADTAGPVLTGSVEDNTVGTQLTFEVETDEWAEVSLIVLAAATPAPSVADVLAGTGALGSGLATDRARRHDAAHLTVTGLSGETAYVAYVAGTDFNGNNSAAVAAIPVTTTIAYFQPSDDANHYATYDPADAVMSGSDVTSLPEKYGTSGLNLAAGSYPPSRRTIDGVSVLDFQTTERLRSTGYTLPAPFTVFAMIRPDTGLPSFARAVSASEATTADSGRVIPIIRDGTTSNFGGYRGSALRGDKALTLDNFVMFMVTVLADGTFKTRVNGGAETSEGSTAYAGTLTYFALGARADLTTVLSSESWDGAIGHCIVVKRDVSADTDERQSLEGWLAHQYGTPANYLPGGHPWLAGPPTL